MPGAELRPTVGQLATGDAMKAVDAPDGRFRAVVTRGQIGAVTGMTRWFEGGGNPSTYKVVLTAFVWLVYAVVLHSPMNPSFRGRKTAVLSVLGFVLMVGTLVAVQFMPGGGR